MPNHELKTFISYEGKPITGGGAHMLGKKHFLEIYDQTRQFLDDFTTNNQVQNPTLTLYSSQQGTYKTAPILWRLVKTFGIPSYNWWKLAHTQHFFTWKLNIRSIDKAIALLQQYNDLPKNDFGPLTLSLYWQFHFIDPNTKTIFPHQELLPEIDFRQKNSQIYLRLGQRSSASVWFAFPFSKIEQPEKKYLSALVKKLPFKPSDKYWRIWQRSNNGNWIPKVLDLRNQLDEHQN